MCSGVDDESIPVMHWEQTLHVVVVVDTRRLDVLCAWSK